MKKVIIIAIAAIAVVFSSSCSHQNEEKISQGHFGRDTSYIDPDGSRIEIDYNGQEKTITSYDTLLIEGVSLFLEKSHTYENYTDESKRDTSYGKDWCVTSARCNGLRMDPHYGEHDMSVKDPFGNYFFYNISATGDTIDLRGTSLHEYPDELKPSQHEAYWNQVYKLTPSIDPIVKKTAKAIITAGARKGILYDKWKF